MECTSDQRTKNNVMRHEYKTLTDKEKSNMQAVKDKGLEFFQLLQGLGSHPQEAGKDTKFTSRELSLASIKIEEAVMWATKHITK